MAGAMGVDPALPVQRALGDVAPRRTLCVSPTTDSAAVPALKQALNDADPVVRLLARSALEDIDPAALPKEK